jgi:hypothetical protein
MKKTINLKPGQFLNFSSEKVLSPICSSLKSTVFPSASTSGTMPTLRHSSNKISAYLCSLILKICSKNTEKHLTAPTAHSITQLLPSFSTNKTSENPQIRQSLQNLPKISTILMDHWSSGTGILARKEGKSSIWKRKPNKYFCLQFYKFWTNLWTSRDLEAFSENLSYGPTSQSTWKTWSTWTGKRQRK